MVTSHSFPVGPRTTPTRNQQRVSYDRPAVQAVLDEATVCHVGFLVSGRPVVLPHLHARIQDRLYLHGSSGARALRMAGRQGLPVCVTVTLVDGIVLARSAFHHSINYRSVVAHGIATVVEAAEEKTAALTALVDAIVPGRSAQTREPSSQELAATSVLVLPLEEVSLKVRSGPPSDDPADLELPYWAGVLPLATTPGPPLPAPDLSRAVVVPDHVSAWTSR